MDVFEECVNAFIDRVRGSTSNEKIFTTRGRSAEPIVLFAGRDNRTSTSRGITDSQKLRKTRTAVIADVVVEVTGSGAETVRNKGNGAWWWWGGVAVRW